MALLICVKGLLDTDGAPKLGARAQSPATSIAETVADTTQEFHSQHQLESQQEQSEIPDTLGSQSPTTFNKTDRTGTQNESSRSGRTDSASTQPHDLAEEHQIESSVLFVENTTQFDHEASVPNLELSPREAHEHSAATQEQPEAIEHSNTQSDAGLKEPELLAVADTPQISQLTSTARESSTQEAQLGSAHRLETVQPNSEHETEISLTERSTWEENVQFPFLSQHPTFFDPRSLTKPTQRALTEPLTTCDTHENSNARLGEGPPSTHQESHTLAESEESTTIDEISQPLGEEAPRISLENHTTWQQSHTQTDDLVHESAACGDIESIVDQVDPGASSQSPLSTEQSSGSREHNAQFVPSSAYLIQEELTEIIHATVKIDPANAPRSKHSSPCSRHDSSQETPERGLKSVEGSLSPIPHPPSYSLRTLDSNVPPKPATPSLSSSLSKMARGTTESGAAHAARRLEEIMAANKSKKRSRGSQSSVDASIGATINDTTSQSNNALALPSINISAEGTRSPSTVPDRSPAPPANTSLRTVAFYNANKLTEPLLDEPPAATPTIAETRPTEKEDDLVAAVAAAAARSVPVVPSPPAAHDDIEKMNEVDSINDYDDDDGSIYDDELKLDDEEYVVPLYIEGRQRDTYTEYIKQKEELLNEVLVHSPAPIEKLDEVDRALAYLKGVETHPDLTYAEAESATGFESRSLADVQHGAQFGIDNSVKFKFLGRFFDRIRDKKMHVVLLLDQDNNALLNILRTFLVAGGYNFKMSTKGYQSTVSPDSLFITVFPRTVTPVLSPVNLIVCLDGVQNAAQARQRKVPASGNTIPVLHLVIPQTVGHIERYILPTTERRPRIEMILAGLARMQTRNEVGNAIDIDTPSAGEAAQMITSWLFPEEDHESTEWPLPSIGSARSFIEWDATQQSVRSAASSPAPERTKRPLVSKWFKIGDCHGH